MPNIKSAKKRVRVTETKTLQNKMYRSALKTEMKKYEAALATGKRDERGRPLGEKGKPVDAPRRPPEDMARNTHAKVTDISAQVAGEYDHYTLTDNNGAVGERKVIATCDRGGKLTAVKGEEEKVQAFLDKGKEGYTLDEDGVVTKRK